MIQLVRRFSPTRHGKFSLLNAIIKISFGPASVIAGGNAPYIGR
jgi:hypothetical protein